MEPKGLPLTHPTLARWNQVLLILKELHASGYMHRDIWPNNILSQAGTQDVLLINFGFSMEAAKIGTLVWNCALCLKFHPLGTLARASGDPVHARGQFGFVLAQRLQPTLPCILEQTQEDCS